MTEGLPIYFPKDLYHRSKVGFKGLVETFNLEWDGTKKAWIGKAGEIEGIFEGHKKPALIYVRGNESLVEQAKEFANLVGAEIREAEVKDIRDKRKEEAEIKKAEDERIKKEEAERVKRANEVFEDRFLDDEFVGADLDSHYRVHKLLKDLPDNWGVIWSDKHIKVDLKKKLSVDENLAWDILVQYIKTSRYNEHTSDLLIIYKLCGDGSEEGKYDRDEVKNAIDTMITEGYIEVVGKEGDGQYVQFVKKPPKPEKNTVRVKSL